MFLVLKKRSLDKEPIQNKVFSTLIKWRLVSKYCHGGIVINNKIMHCTSKGLVSEDFTITKSDRYWDVIDLGNEIDDYVLDLFEQYKGTKYDWFSLIGFILPWRVTNRKAMYCFEWCLLAMGGIITERVTPENLYLLAIDKFRARYI